MHSKGNGGDFLGQISQKDQLHSHCNALADSAYQLATILWRDRALTKCCCFFVCFFVGVRREAEKNLTLLLKTNNKTSPLLDKSFKK